MIVPSAAVIPFPNPNIALFLRVFEAFKGVLAEFVLANF